ncbi:MAG TPA: dTMP kinase [Solirubrobacteraceae bacterium]|nr:dTMP kinase [Solirubrobacteraceae bacterium]
MARGKLITIEGIDGAGKSTLAAALRDALVARGLPAELVREPGGVELSERLRALVTDPALEVSPRAEALLYLAARAQLVVELLEPRLAAGAILILDRFSDSTLAYQGGGRGLGVPAMRDLDAFATGGLRPDLTLLLRLPPELVPERLAARPERPAAGLDRLEAEPPAFFAAIAAAYETLAAAEPGRFRVLDATAPPGDVLAAALDAIDGAATI